MERVKRSVVARGKEGGKDEQAEHRGLLGRVKLLCMKLLWWIHVIIHLSKLIECTTLTVNPRGGIN